MLLEWFNMTKGMGSIYLRLRVDLQCLPEGDCGLVLGTLGSTKGLALCDLLHEVGLLFFETCGEFTILLH